MKTQIQTDKQLLDVADFKSLPEYDGHELVIALNDPEAGLEAFVAIHNSNRGIAHGGTRIQVYNTTVDALADALELSKAMSYKSALADLPYGGAKGVIILPTGTVNRDKILAAYAKRIEQLNGLFHTGTDVGLTEADVQKMAEHTRYMLGVKLHEGSDLSTSKAAALGCFYAVQATASFVYGSDSLIGKKVAIKGLGKLGAELAHLFHGAGATLIVADIDQAKVDVFLQDHPNVSVVSHDDIHKQSVDIYSPCALGHEFYPENIDELQCTIVCGGANNQLITPEVGDILFEKRICYVPDYIANAGGLIYVSEELELDGFHADRVDSRLQNIQNTLQMIFERVSHEHKAPHRIADMIALERIQYKANT